MRKEEPELIKPVMVSICLGCKKPITTSKFKMHKGRKFHNEKCIELYNS